MAETPPPFQEASRCDVCNCSFTAFRRRHHCRCCGRTLCNEHSSNYMALPQFGIYTDVRVCFDCLNNSSGSKKDDKQTFPVASHIAEDSLSRLTIDDSTVSTAKTTSGEFAVGIPECKCGMPLCICVVPTPEPAPTQIKNTTISSVQSNPKPKKTSSSQQLAESTSRKQAAASSSNPSSFFHVGQASNNTIDKARSNYEVSGEGIREAIKNSDATAVIELLSKGVDPNYCDKKGLTLLHLAAVFNQTEIVFILMDHGASTESKNAQGETPLECAPTMLQYKMRKKMEELAAISQA
ncbi:vacuolar protein sorting-associated protein 27 isoform X1 [Canna indica]|uniref:Vacuolar protein sorting-associated protein 27 isoform X1 n=1 Tax=Canna indica TaxID=4628 RepID=A0AAQ3JWP1_9LILI|nr:vacuolar protein sorting-associated protein 27 isoform X1 [Canna indica]